MNSKKLIFILIGLVILVAVSMFVFTSNKKVTTQVEPTPSEEAVITMKPEDIGLSLALSPDNKKIIFQIKNTQNIAEVIYDLFYTAKVNDQDVKRGVNGEIKQMGQLVERKLDLGTCSDVCHYDVGVSNIKLILKVTKTDGTTAQVEKSL
jgi:hypothetical protein